MSITSEVRKAGPLPCNGVTTVFNFAFKCFAASDLYVKLSDGTTETLLVKDTNYTVALNADQDLNPGGTITTIGTASPYTAAYTLTITSQITNTQGTQLPNAGGWFPKVIENALDRCTVLAQQVLGYAIRSIRQPISDATAIAELPSAANRASKYLFFDASGNPTAVTGVSGTTPVTAFMATVLDDGDANTAVQTLVAGLSAEASAALDDQVVFSDTSEGKGNKIRLDDLLNFSYLSSEAAPAIDDLVAISDTSEGKGNKMRLDDLLKVVNGLTAKVSPSGANDMVLIYDVAGAAAAKISIQTLAAAGIRGYLQGGGISNSAGDPVNDIDVSIARAIDSSNTTFMQLAGGNSGKQLDVAWAAGANAGMRDTGAIADGTWHIFIIKADATGTGDVLASLSPTAPTMPPGYTFFRRIGSILREAGSIVAVSQNGDEFLRKASVLDVNANNPGAAAVTRTLAVPTGIVVRAIVNWGLGNAAAGVAPYGYVSSLDQNDEVPTASLNNIGAAVQAAAGGSASWGSQLTIRTNSSAQVRTRLSASDGNVTLRGSTVGWLDSRGRGN